MSSLYGFLGKQFPSPRSSYSFDFSHHDMPNDYWDDFGRSHRSVNEHAFPSSHPRSRLPSLNGLASSLTYAHRPNASTTQNSLRVVVDPHISYSPQTPVEASSIFSPETSPVWTGSSSSSTVASPASSIFPSRFVKEEEPESPKFIIEPLLPSSLVNKRLSSSSPAPVSPLTQAELESQLLLSQALAPPTEVPLRATQACTEMRQMMRSFRLNPFSILTSNGKDPKSDSGPVLTWCGEIAGPLEEPPQIFEWQLQGYSSGLEAELPKLIVMDDVDDFFNMAEEDGTSGLEAVSGEEIESPMISPSLLLSEAASSSGFSTPAETEASHLGYIGSLSRASFVPRFYQNMDIEQRAGSADSGYESTASSAHSSQVIDERSYRIVGDRRFHPETHHTAHGLPLHKKRRLDTRLNTVISPRESCPPPYDSSSGASQVYGYEAVLSSSVSSGTPTSGGSPFRTLESQGSLSTSRGSKAFAQSSTHDPHHRRSSSGSMHLPTLLNANPIIPSSSSLSSSSNSFKPVFGHASDSQIISRSSSSSSSTDASSVPSVQDVANIWANAANPEPAPRLREPGSEYQHLRKKTPWRDTDMYSELPHGSRLEPIRQPSLYAPGIPIARTEMPDSTLSCSSSASHAPLQHYGQQQQFAHLQGRPSRPLLSPLLDTAATRLRDFASGHQGNPHGGGDIQQPAFGYGVYGTSTEMYSATTGY